MVILTFKNYSYETFRRLSKSLGGLTDKEYIHLLESYYFFDNDKFQKILHSKGYISVVIPEKTPYAIYFKDGVRVSKEEYDKFMVQSCI